MKNEPAFPIKRNFDEDLQANLKTHLGLSKREYFAAMLWTREVSKRSLKYGERPAERARRAVENADALIAELEKTK